MTPTVPPEPHCKAVGCSESPVEDGWCATHAAYWREPSKPVDLDAVYERALADGTLTKAGIEASFQRFLDRPLASFPAVPPEPQLTRVQCGKCAWMSAAHESPAEAYLEVGAHFVNVHRYAATAVPSEPDTKKREPGCQCHLEEGDSPCRVHGDDAAAAPLTVAPARPAREVAHAIFTGPHNWCTNSSYDPAFDRHAPNCDRVTMALQALKDELLEARRGRDAWIERALAAEKALAERDRASRSPGLSEPARVASLADFEQSPDEARNELEEDGVDVEAFTQKVAARIGEAVEIHRKHSQGSGEVAAVDEGKTGPDKALARALATPPGQTKP